MPKILVATDADWILDEVRAALGGETTTIRWVRNGKDVVPTSGKSVPGSPEWMNKFVATMTVADTEFQLTRQPVCAASAQGGIALKSAGTAAPMA